VGPAACDRELDGGELKTAAPFQNKATPSASLRASSVAKERGKDRAIPFQLAADFKMRMTASIVLQLRVVAGAPRSLSS
jgi:hypothetical protein